MKKLGKWLLLWLTISPSIAFAHGEQIIVPFLIDFGSIIVFLILIEYVLKPDKREKVVLTQTFIVVLFLTFIIFINVGYSSYLEYFSLMNLVFFLIPLVAVLFTYLILKRTKS